MDTYITLAVLTLTFKAADSYKIKNNIKTLNMTLKNSSLYLFYVYMCLESNLAVTQIRYGQNTQGLDPGGDSIGYLFITKTTNCRQ
jgi:hypothetical protein